MHRVATYRHSLRPRGQEFRVQYDQIADFEPFSDGASASGGAQTAKSQAFKTRDAWFGYILPVKLAQIKGKAASGRERTNTAYRQPLRTYATCEISLESIHRNHHAKRLTMTTKAQTSLPLPDPPEREPEDMTSFQHLAKNGNLHHLTQYLGNPETTIVEGKRYIIKEPGAPASERMVPDLIIAFDVNPEAYREDNGYVVSRQGKAPDLIMEIASPSTRSRDTLEKRDRYASLARIHRT